MNKKILLVDDDLEMLNSIGSYLTVSGHEIFKARNGQEAINILSDYSNYISLVITDVIMPVVGGIELCHLIKEKKEYKHLPVLILTTMSDISNKYIGFSAGADDYLTKPFEKLELLLRIEVILKREKQKEEEKKVESNFLIMNKENHTVRIRKQSVYLSPLEFDMLFYLYNNSDRLVSLEEIFTEVFHYPPGTGNSDTIRAHIRSIRSKIEVNPSDPKIITNIPKRGYKLNSSL